MTTGTEISTTLTKWQGSLSKYALVDYNESVFINSAYLAVMQSKELQECFKTDDGKASLFQAMRFASSTGLSLNPQEGKAALIAYKGKAQYQIMKNGMMELAERSGKVKTISSDTVRENDEFSIEKTSDGDKYSFTPARKDRGEIDGFFAALVKKDGECHVKYMTTKEVDHFKNTYSKGHVHNFDDKYGKFKKGDLNGHAWNTSFEGMGIKTVIKSLLRGVSISPEVSAAIGSDDESNQPEPPMINITPTKSAGVNAKDIMEELDKEPKVEVIGLPDQKKAAANDVKGDEEPFFEKK